MDDLGKLIAGEWAKNNKTRLINTRNVSVWVNALIKSVDHLEILKMIEQVSNDVNALLNREITVEKM